MLLTLISILLGVISLTTRKSHLVESIFHALVGIGILGAGASAWRFCEFHKSINPSGNVDPQSWFTEHAIAWMPAAIVFPLSELL